MTLILGATVGGSFCVTSGDTMTVFYEAFENLRTGEVTVNEDKVIGSKETTKKVIFLNDYVTFGAAGKSNIIDHIKKKIKEKVNLYDSLITVSVKLDNLIQDMRKEEDPPFYYRFLDVEEEFGIILNGFDSDGRSGFAYFISGTEEVMIRYAEKGKLDYMMWSPSCDYTDKKDEFLDIKLDGTKNDLNTVINQFLKVHTVISFFQPEEVSDICEYKILIKKGNTKEGYARTLRKKGSKKVSEFYKKMGFM